MMEGGNRDHVGRRLVHCFRRQDSSLKVLYVLDRYALLSCSQDLSALKMIKKTAQTNWLDESATTNLAASGGAPLPIRRRRFSRQRSSENINAIPQGAWLHGRSWTDRGGVAATRFGNLRYYHISQNSLPVMLKEPNINLSSGLFALDPSLDVHATTRIAGLSTIEPLTIMSPVRFRRRQWKAAQIDALV